jgi:branched-chain amino acid aminotransferase
VRFWLDGELVDAVDARVPVLDHGFTVGDGVFETLKVVPGPDGTPVPFALDRHVARLGRSAAGLGIQVPPADQVRAGALSVCAANPELMAGGRLRITLTSGAGPLGSERGAAAVTLAMAVSVGTAWARTSRVALSPWPRNERSALTGLKTTSYAENVMMLAHARRLGVDEAVLLNLAGALCEGTGSNIFVVIDGVILTPPLASGCLAGVTRELTLQWCAEADIECAEREIRVAQLTAADEVFITSSTRDIHPVVEVLDETGRRLWAGVVGDRTRLAAQVFTRRAAADWNP